MADLDLSEGSNANEYLFGETPVEVTLENSPSGMLDKIVEPVTETEKTTTTVEKEEEVKPEPTTELVNPNQPETGKEEEADILGTDMSKWTPKQVDAYRALQAKNQKNHEEARKLSEQNEALKHQLEEFVSKTNQPAKENKTEEVLPPVRPVKPTDFDVYDSINDPDSNSYKWREAHEEYLVNIADYNAKTIDKLNRTINEERQMKELQIKAATAKAQVIGQLSQFLPPEEAAKAFDFVSSNESLTPENIAIYYKAKFKSSQPEKTIKEKPKKEISPIVPGLGSDKNPDDRRISPDEEFSKNLLTTKY